MKNAAWEFLALWGIALFFIIIAVIFLHEVGHGIGATIDGIHMSTGFNRVGMPNKTPGDPDFRVGMREGVWTGLLGPMLTWALAIASTIAQYRLRKPTRLFFAISAMAVANGLLRAIPMTTFALSALAGQLHFEDEVSWGIWADRNIFRSDLARVPATEIPTALLLSSPAVWIPPLVSLVISLVCLVFAFRRIFVLESATLSNLVARFSLVALGVIAWVAALPVINALDRVIRINW